MPDYRRIGRMVGALFLLSNVVFILGAVVFLEPLVNAPNYLELISANRIQLVLGVLLELINGVAYVGIAVLMFPIFRPRFESLALAYVGFRLIEFVMQTLADLSPLALLDLSQVFVEAGATDAAPYLAAGTILVAGRNWAFQMVSIALVLGAFLFYTMLFQTRLVPRFLSIWGWIGALVVLVNAVSDMLGYPPGNLGIVMLGNEVFLGIWLLLKGFNPVQQDQAAPRPALAGSE